MGFRSWVYIVRWHAGKNRYAAKQQQQILACTLLEEMLGNALALARVSVDFRFVRGTGMDLNFRFVRGTGMDLWIRYGGHEGRVLRASGICLK
jgi:hypothetical protein